ncbi:MAG: ATP-binding cassette domain-containing protein [Enterocloster clostridioformis]
MSLDHVSLTIRRGEILGIAGVEGNGQKEPGRGNNRNPQIKSGQMEYQGKDIRKDSVKERFRAGISYISDDRHGDSLVMDMTVEDNLILRDFDREPFSRKMVLDYRQAEKRARRPWMNTASRPRAKAASKHR